MIHNFLKTVASGDTDVVLTMEELRGIFPDACVVKKITAGSATGLASIIVSDGTRNLALDTSSGAGVLAEVEDIYLSADKRLINTDGGVDRILVTATTADVNVYISISDKIH